MPPIAQSAEAQKNSAAECFMKTPAAAAINAIVSRSTPISMDTKARIKELMDERNWSIYELSKRSGLAQTTISNMWKRNTEPTIPSLRALCDGFGISLAEFFSEGNLSELSSEQREVLLYWSSLSPKHKELIIELMKSMK